MKKGLTKRRVQAKAALRRKMEPFEVRIELNNKDREMAMDYNFFVRRKWVLIDIIFFVLLALTLIVLKLTGIVAIGKPLFVASVGILVMIASFFFFIKVLSGAGGNGPGRYVIISEEAFATRVGSEKKVITVKWEDFTYRKETKNYFFLYPDAAQFFILPKRCFTAEQIAALHSHII